jgi:hypothetical protein
MVIWNISRSSGVFSGHLVMLWKFGIFSLVLVYCVKKNLATLHLAVSRDLTALVFQRFSPPQHKSLVVAPKKSVLSRSDSLFSTK